MREELPLQQRVLRDRHTASQAKVENCVDNEGDLVESNLIFIREVPMIHVNLIITVVIDSDYKNRRYYFRPASRNIRK